MDVKLLGIWFWICTLPAIQVSCESPNIRSVNSKIGVKDAFDADDADDAAPDLDPVVEDSFDAAANAVYFVGEDGYLVDSDVDYYDEDSYDADADVDYMYRSSSNRTHTQHNTTHPLNLDEPKEYDHDHTNHHQDPLQQQKHQYQNKDDEHQHLHHNNQQQQQHEDDHHDEHLHHHEDEQEEQHHESDHQLYEHEIHQIHQHDHMHQQHQRLQQHEDEYNHDDVYDKHQRLHHNNQQQQQHEHDHHDEHLHHHEDEEEEQHHENDHQLYEHEIHKIHQHGHMHQQHQKLQQHEDEHNHDDVHDKHQHDTKQQQHEDEHKYRQMNIRVHSNIDKKKQEKDNLQQKQQNQNKDDEDQHLHHNNQQQQQHEDDHHDEHLHHHEDEQEEQRHESDHQLYEHEIHKIHQHGHMHQQHQKLEQHEDEHNHDDVHDKHQHDIKQRQHEDEHKHGQMNNRVHSNIDMKKQKKDNLIDVSDVEKDHENQHNHDDTHDSRLQKKPTSASAQKQQHNNKVVHVHSNDPSHQPYHSSRDHINIYTDMMQADARFHEHNSYYHFEPQHHKQYRNHPHYPKKDSIRVPNHKQKEDHGHGHQHGTRKRLDEISVSIWLAGFGSILFISLVGVGSVLFLPMLKGNRSETILQFLIAVAVGTLVGDAFIHLVPHAFLQTHDTSTTWKGFVATMVILGFFTLDQILSLKGMSHSHSHVHAVPTDEPAHHAVPTVQHHGTRTVPTVQYHDAEPSQPTSPPPTPAIYKECRTGDESMSFLSADSGHPIVSNHHHLHTQDSHSERGEESFSKPSNFSSTNLMVIIGDAIHNFADGIAIGAAFSMGYATGLSTSIAVLCHELPHEIGDFAILIQNGMKTRTALFFNVISSITGFIGMCIGLLLGSTGDFSTWLLAGIVGVFLYVALVSMLPELRANNLRDVVVNITGISGGAVLLLIIGLYEEKLINLFTFS